MVGNHGRRTVDDQLVEADISSFYVPAEGRRFFQQYWDAIDHLLDSEDQRKCSIRDVLSPAESSRSSALRVCHSAVDCSPVPADYVGLSSASVDVTGLAADHEDTGSSQTIVVRSVAATGASV